MSSDATLVLGSIERRVATCETNVREAKRVRDAAASTIKTLTAERKSIMVALRRAKQTKAPTGLLLADWKQVEAELKKAQKSRRVALAKLSREERNLQSCTSMRELAQREQNKGSTTKQRREEEAFERFASGIADMDGVDDTMLDVYHDLSQQDTELLKAERDLAEMAEDDMFEVDEDGGATVEDVLGLLHEEEMARHTTSESDAYADLAQMPLPPLPTDQWGAGDATPGASTPVAEKTATDAVQSPRLPVSVDLDKVEGLFDLE